MLKEVKQCSKTRILYPVKPETWHEGGIRILSGIQGLWNFTSHAPHLWKYQKTHSPERHQSRKQKKGDLGNRDTTQHQAQPKGSNTSRMMRMTGPRRDSTRGRNKRNIWSASAFGRSIKTCVTDLLEPVDNIVKGTKKIQQMKSKQGNA